MKAERGMEREKRSLMKAVVWQALGLIAMVWFGLAMAGWSALGGEMAVLNACFGLAAYGLFKQAWARFDWGRSHG
jgi:uncharacterized membrane protein